ncbi:MAG: SRPBCC domain-containing protein [Chitinophagaceae bacterium]|nr:SRPBCC domain-containing protein [Chitinophagaceae bacterium]
MTRKTKIHAEEDRHDLLITREFDLPLELLFRAYAEKEIVEQWMGTHVVAQDNRKFGNWHYQTSDGDGNIVFEAHGTFHDFVPNEKIIRTFEMINAPFDVQLEFLEFTSLGEERSKLNMQIVYRTIELRNQMLKLPFEYGLNMAHDKLEKLLTT